MSQQIRQFTARQVGEALGADESAIAAAELIIQQRESAGRMIVSVELPLPPVELSKNARVGRRTIAPLYAKHREDARRAVWSALNSKDFHARGGGIYRGETWPAVDMVIVWKSQARWFPDDDNAIARCAAYRDGAADAGLVANDQDIRAAGVIYEDWRGKYSSGVELRFYEPIEAAAAASAGAPVDAVELRLVEDALERAVRLHKLAVKVRTEHEAGYSISARLRALQRLSEALEQQLRNITEGF
jgi:hypothetical protein